MENEKIKKQLYEKGYTNETLLKNDLLIDEVIKMCAEEPKGL